MKGNIYWWSKVQQGPGKPPLAEQGLTTELLSAQSLSALLGASKEVRPAGLEPATLRLEGGCSIP